VSTPPVGRSDGRRDRAPQRRASDAILRLAPVQKVVADLPERPFEGAHREAGADVEVQRRRPPEGWHRAVDCRQRRLISHSSWEGFWTRGNTARQVTMLAVIDADQLIPADHPIRRVKPIVEAALRDLELIFATM